LAAWFKAAGISVEQVEHLEGGELTVTLWLGAKAGVRQRQRRAA
jgi:ArsR family transcriptional regulator